MPDDTHIDRLRGVPIGVLVKEMQSKEDRRSGTSILGIYFSRPLGRILAAIAFRLRMTPNGVTILSLTLTVIAATLILGVAATSPLWATIAAVILIIAELLDYSDGDLARLTRSGSALGEWLDHTVDPAKRVLVAGAIAASLIDTKWAFAAAVTISLYLAVVMVTYTGGTLYSKMRAASELPKAKTEEPTPLRRMASTSFLAMSDPLLVAIAALMVPYPQTLWIYLVGLTVGNTLVMLALTRKWSVDLAAAS